MLRTVVFWDLSWGLPISGKYHFWLRRRGLLVPHWDTSSESSLHIGYNKIEDYNSFLTQISGLGLWAWACVLGTVGNLQMTAVYHLEQIHLRITCHRPVSTLRCQRIPLSVLSYFHVFLVGRGLCRM